MKDMPRVYVAGRYSSDKILEVFANMRKGMRKSTELLVRGYAPFCPWLDYQYSLMLQGDEQIDVEKYYHYSLAWLEVSDAMLVLPGWEGSKGVTAEIALAELCGIPVFYDEETLFDYYETNKTTMAEILNVESIPDAEITNDTNTTQS